MVYRLDLKSGVIVGSNPTRSTNMRTVRVNLAISDELDEPEDFHMNEEEYVQMALDWAAMTVMGVAEATYCPVDASSVWIIDADGNETQVR
jgi:hypothetical protein